MGDTLSNKIIGQNQADMAVRLFDGQTSPVHGPVDYRQIYWDITNEVVLAKNGSLLHLCNPAMVSQCDGIGYTKHLHLGILIWYAE